jgi:transitional endoplasmic reticulum ATPase
MLAIRQLIDKNRDLITGTAGAISISENHFEEAIQLVLKQNANKK